MIYNNLVSHVIYNIGLFIEYIGVIVVIVSVFIALYQLVLRRYELNEIRLRFARDIIFGLDFVIAADILLVTSVNDPGEVLQLGGMVLIRILLGYSLHREINSIKKLK